MIKTKKNRSVAQTFLNGNFHCLFNYSSVLSLLPITKISSSPNRGSPLIMIALVPPLICSQTIETDIEYKNKNVSKNTLRIFEAHFLREIKNIEPRAKKSPFL